MVPIIPHCPVQGLQVVSETNLAHYIQFGSYLKTTHGFREPLATGVRLSLVAIILVLSNRSRYWLRPVSG